MTVDLMPPKGVLVERDSRSALAAQALRAIAGLTVMLGLWLVLFRTEAGADVAGGLAIGVGLALTAVAECLRVVRRRRADADADAA